MKEAVGYLGMGVMGTPMARNLLKTGYKVVVWNRTRDKAEAMARHPAELAETPAELAETPAEPAETPAEPCSGSAPVPAS